MIEALTQSEVNTGNTSLVPSGFFSTFKVTGYNPEAIATQLSDIGKGSKIFTLYGKPHGSIFKSDRLLLNGITMHLSFTRAPDVFCLMGTAASSATANDAVEPKLDLRNMSVFVRKVRLTPNLLNAHALALQRSKAIYPIKRSLVKVFNLPTNQSGFVFDNVFMGQMPCKIIFGLVNNNAYSGSYLLNPFKFNHNNLTFVALHLNGEMLPKSPYTPNFDDDNYRREYYDFLLNTGAARPGAELPIDYTNYKLSHALFAFNLNNDFEFPSENEYVNIPKEGFMNIELKFKANIQNALKLIVYAQFDNVIEIDESRNVTVDYS